jgi:hypothetical protein
LPSAAVMWEPDTASLPRPKNVRAVRFDTNAVLLRWDAVDGALSYVVRRNNNRNTAGYAIVATPVDTFFRDSTPFDYYYFVEAVNASDTSAPSDTVEVIDSLSVVVLPPEVTDCQVVRDGESINAKIVEVLASALHKGTICPEPGRYDEGTIEVAGKVEVWIR